MLSSLRISFFFISALLCATSVAQTGGYGSPEKTLEEWDKARSEMCAEVTVSKVTKTEAAAACSDCIAKPLIGKMAEKLAIQSKKIESAAQDQKELLFFRDFFKNSAYMKYSKDEANIFLKAYGQILDLYNSIYISKDETKTLYELGESYAILKKDDLGKEKAKRDFVESLALVKQTFNARKELGVLLDMQNSGYLNYYTTQMQALVEATKAIDEFDISDKNLENSSNLDNLIAKLVTAATAPSAFTKKQTENVLRMFTDIFNAGEEFKKGFPDEVTELAWSRSFARKISATIGMSKTFCGLSDAEQFAIVYYTGSGYATINAALRSEEKTGATKAFRDLLNSGLSKLKKYEGDVIRGASMPDSAVESYKAGAVISHPSFTSASKSVGFSGTQQFFIKSKKGHYIAPISASPTEEEVLFSADSKFKVLSVEPMSVPSAADDEITAEAKKKLLKITMEEVE